MLALRHYAQYEQSTHSLSSLCQSDARGSRGNQVSSIIKYGLVTIILEVVAAVGVVALLSLN